MNSTVTKVKTNFSPSSKRFEFSKESTIPAKAGLTLIITASGGVSARLQATLCDAKDVARNATGTPDEGAPDETGVDGSMAWPFSAQDCLGGYLKWRCWVSEPAGGWRPYTITEEIRDNGKTLFKTVVRCEAPDGVRADSPFLDGVQIGVPIEEQAERELPHAATGDFEFKFGDSGEAVRDLQRKLATLADAGESHHTPFYAGPCDGFYNRGMEKAIHDFKRNRKHRRARTDRPASEGSQASQNQQGIDAICDEQTWRDIDQQAGSVFAETWQFEYQSLRKAHAPIKVDPVDESLLAAEVHGASMAGLAFSGGGIRSATFNLGVLQAFADLRLLRDFDYLSTVSGGGYIGSWFSKWLHRLGGNVNHLEQRLGTVATAGMGKSEAEEIRFLRQYSNYLTAKTGFFSADTWSVLSIYFRNTLLNMIILVAILGAALVIPRMLALGAGSVAPTKALAQSATAPAVALATGTQIGVAAIVLVLWSVFCIALSISTRPDPARPKWLGGQSQESIILCVVLPLMMAATLGSLALWDMRETIEGTWRDLWDDSAIDRQRTARWNVFWWLCVPGLAYFSAWLAGWSSAQLLNLRSFQRTHPGEKPPMPTKGQLTGLGMEGFGHFGFAVIALAVGAFLAIVTTTALARIKQPPDAFGASVAVDVFAFGMPVLLTLFGITMILSIGLIGRMYSEKSREWWARQGGWTIICVTGWLALVAVSLYAPPLLAWAHAHSRGWATAVLGSTWATTTLAGLLLGSSGSTGKKDSSRVLEFIAMLAPYVFCVGMLILVSSLVHALTAAQSGQPVTGPVPDATSKFLVFVDYFNRQTLAVPWSAYAITAVCMLIVGWGLARRVDINKFSMHMMYRNRLVRAYLGASNDKRKPHPFTGFDENDDITLDKLLLKTGAKGGDDAIGDSKGKTQRPYHIINTALNMVNGKELAWQTRKAGGFSFTPAFCGFELPSMAAPGGPKIADEALRGAYRRTTDYRREELAMMTDDNGLKLGMAMATSGAAASPNMGFHSSAPLAFLMTLFNVRLGRWFANPRRMLDKDKRTAPRTSLFPLFSELTGNTDAKSKYVYLSDGGHFENLAVYELVRRRCRLIVVIDAGADAPLHFDDLGNMIRKCATDLRVEISVNVSRIDRERDALFSRDHCVAGVIDYTKADGEYAPPGTLLYIKPSLLGTECAELINYRKTDAAFPHQSTADQWFDETQFESYRALGYHIGKMALEEAATTSTRSGAHPDGHETAHDIDKLCNQIHARWSRKPPEDRSQAAVYDINGGDRRRFNRRRERPSNPLAHLG